MRENRIRTIWKRGEAVVNGWLAIPNVFSAETMAHAGWDSLTVDMQHGVVDYNAALAMLTAISTTSTMPLVRVPWLDPGIIMKLLDAGAYGLLYAGADYPQHANDTVLAIAMIETRQALDNLDDILSVEGLDAIYIGPNDLSLTLGCKPKLDQDEKIVVEAIDHILERAKKHGVVAGIHNGTVDYALKMIAKGFQFVTVGSDSRFMAAGAQQVVAAMRAKPAKPANGGSTY